MAHPISAIRIGGISPAVSTASVRSEMQRKNRVDQTVTSAAWLNSSVTRAIIPLLKVSSSPPPWPFSIWPGPLLPSWPGKQGCCAHPSFWWLSVAQECLSRGTTGSVAPQRSLPWLKLTCVVSRGRSWKEAGIRRQPRLCRSVLGGLRSALSGQ